MKLLELIKIFFANLFQGKVPNLQNSFGANKSINDYRTHIVSNAIVPIQQTIPTLPSALQTDFQELGISNQMREPSCVSHSIVYLLKLYFFLKTGKIIDFSPRFLDIISGLKKYNGYADFGLNDGRDPLTVLKLAQKYGCATQATLPNDTTLSINQYRDPSTITESVIAEASQYKIPGYVSIPLNREAIRQAIVTYGAVSILFRVGQELWTDRNGNITYSQALIDPLRTPKTIIAGHQMTGSGYNALFEHLVNSWGISWAEQGEADYNWDDWEPYILEAWVIADVPGEILKTVQGLPQPGEFVHNFTTKLNYGMSGDEVKSLQIALNLDGEFTYPEITGYYGLVTAMAVSAFQYKYKLAPSATLNSIRGINSVVGPATLKQLNILFNPSNPLYKPIGKVA